MEQGIRRISWSFDAADSLQAYLAIRRLAAFARGFSAAPVARDGLAEWWLSSSRVRMRLEGGRRPPDLADYLEAETPKLNPAALDGRDLPIPCDVPETPARSLALVELPSDIHRLAAVDGALANAWRDQIQAVLQDAFQRGYLATDFLYLKGERLPRSYYLLSHGEALLGL
jgi:predicted GNAT superfamily acetyltransferase